MHKLLQFIHNLGERPPVDAYLKVIAVLLIAAVVSLFVLVQIFIGITKCYENSNES